MQLVAGHRPGRDLALGVAGGRREAQPRDGLVALGQLHQEALDRASRGRRRISSRPVANGSSVPAWPTFTPLPQPAPDPRDDVVRRHPRGLVDERTPSVRSELLVRPARAGTSPARGTRGRWRSPAARRCPPPPRARAIRETSMRSSVARSETLRGRLAAELLAHEPGDRGALDRAQVVDDALGVALVGAGGAVVVARSGASRSAGRRRSARRWSARAPAARACPAGCPRRGAGRSRAASTPPAISSAAISCARGPVFSYMKRPVSVTRPTYSASPIAVVTGTPSPCIRSHTISAVHDACGSTWLIVPKRVLSWWWSMLTISARPARA